ncbi:unnamed protein product [Lupinus luteus]|uniref:Uncharacterized protein n=1 Tax=Lupinus luteus TaxID=3873 RepID=A0AAV1VXY6_LUPLU
MAESTEKKSDTKAELATMREQMAEMFHMLKALQSEKGKDKTSGSQHHSDTARKKTTCVRPDTETYTDLFAYLQRQGMITPILGRVPDNPGPWYNADATYAYHSSAPGHLLENCKAFKFKVQDLINSRQIDFRETRPNVTGNPLPNHGNQEANTIETGGELTIVKEVEHVKMPMGFIFQEMCKQGLVELAAQETDEAKSCEMHGCDDHNLEYCEDFKSLLQRMMDLKLVVIEGHTTEHEVNVVKDSQEEILVFI